MRFVYYIGGLLILALGLTLNTKTGLGVSAIISVPYSISSIGHFNFGNTTMVVYCIFVFVQLLLKGKQAKVYDLLQIPLALLFTRFLNLFDHILTLHFDSFLPNCALLVMAIVFTGIGAAMSVNVRLVPNPGDGIVQAISDRIGKGLGFTKNCFDLLNIFITIFITLVFAGHLIGVGIGTVAAVVGVGRVVALFNHFCKGPMEENSGICIDTNLEAPEVE